MERSVNERLMRYLDFKGIKVSRAEKDLGLANGYIRKLKGAPGAEKLDSILSLFVDLSREWLLYGIGDMLKPEYTTFNPIGVAVPVPVPEGEEPEAPSEPTNIGYRDQLIASLQDEIKHLREQLAVKDAMINNLISHLK